MAERAADRLTRLIGIVTYLDAHGEAALDDLAGRFGVSRQQVLADVDTLWLTGTPGYQPDDLIDFDAFSLDEGVVRLTTARGLTRPLRLGAREAVALIAGLRALQATLGPALDDARRAVVDSALAKVSAAAGVLADDGPLDVHLEPDAPARAAAAVADASTRGRRLRLRYVDASDRTTVRDVDPVRLVTADGVGYLLAWSLAADAERLFRLDRVLDAVVLDEPAAAHEVATDAERYEPSGELVTLRLRSRARWIAETAPVEAVRNLDDGSFEVDLRVESAPWLVTLLMRSAGAVLDVTPDWPARRAADAARAALAAYGEG